MATVASETEVERKPMSPARTLSKDWKEKASDWLFQQGVSTVLLVSILAFLGYMVIFKVPEHIQMIQQGYRENAAALETALQKIADSHDKDREFFRALLERGK